MSLITSLVKGGLSQAKAEHYAALIEDFSAQQVKLMAQLEAAGLTVFGSMSLKPAGDASLSDADFVARVRELLEPHRVHEADNAQLLSTLERLLSEVVTSSAEQQSRRC